MPLLPKDRIGQAIRGAANVAKRAVIVARAVESGLAFLQAYVGGDPDDAANQDLGQEADIDHIQHVGFESFPVPGDATEGVVVDTDAGEACIAERRAIPSGLAALAQREARIYGEDGQSVLMKTGGDIEAEPKAGKHMKVGATATEFAAMANLVLTELQDIKTWADAHTHLVPGALGGGPGITSNAPTGAMPAPNIVRCTKLKIE
jgi:hypothetical protein